MEIEQIFKNHNRSKMYNFGVYLLYEDIIRNGIVNLPGLNLKKLNTQYNPAGIFFHKHKDINEFEGRYEPENDEIHIYFGKNVNKDEVEAILSHELVHKEQHKKSNGKWQSNLIKQINKINDLYKKIKKEKDVNKRLNLKKEYRKLLDEFHYKSPQEEMAYAMQFVKGRKSYGFNSPNDIVIRFKDSFSNKFKKYVYLYWQIKDKI